MMILYGYTPVDYSRGWNCWKPVVKRPVKRENDCFASSPSACVWLVPGTEDAKVDVRDLIQVVTNPPLSSH